MNGVFTAELTRLFRPSPIVTAACAVAAPVLAVIALALLLPEHAAAGAAADGAARMPMDLEALTSPDGAPAAVRLLAPQLAIVAYCLFALSCGRDLTHATARVARLQGPSARRIHVGRLLALGALTAAVSAIALVATLLAGGAAALSRGASLKAWTSAPALDALFQQWAGVTLAGCCLGALGALAALATRSGGAATGIGLVTLLVIDPLLSVWQPLRGLTPGALINEVAWCAPDRTTAMVAVAVTTALAAWAGTSVYERRSATA
ncbi:hypothetical protein [Streptomyces cyaneofuscatus]|uniref:hypothetical protein n=1 Tax=Streptomyces cyaneofuscatus TaxID=66883 RepID=UPI0034342521